MKGVLFSMLLGIFIPAGVSAQLISAEHFALIDRPFNGEQATMSSDGRYVAFTQYTEDYFVLTVADLEHGTLKSIPIAPSDKGRNGQPLPRLVDLRWLPGHRLLVENDTGAIIAMDPDGGNRLEVGSAGATVGNYRWEGQLGLAMNLKYGPPRILNSTPGNPAGFALVDVVRVGNLEVAPQIVTVDAVSGKISALSQLNADGAKFSFPAYRQYIYDLSNASRISFPSYSNEYEENRTPKVVMGYYGERVREFVLTSKPSGEGKTLDKLLGNAKAPEFNFEPKLFFQERSFPLGFDYDPQILYYASNKGRDTWGIYALDLRSMQRRQIAPDLAGYDLTGWLPEERGQTPLIFDETKRTLVGLRYTGIDSETYWIDPELRQVQADLEGRQRPRKVTILGWDAARELFLVRSASSGMPGSLSILHRTEEPGDEEILASEAPWLEPEDIFPQSSFSFAATQGVRLSGYLTLPKAVKARGEAPPVVIHLRSGPWDREPPGFDRDAQALTSMGLIVMRLNVRGSGGFGRNFLESAWSDLAGIPLDDLRSAVDWLGAQTRIDRSRIVVMGEGYGAFLALGAVQKEPQLFRYAIALNGPADLAAWLSEHQGGEPTNHNIRFNGVLSANDEMFKFRYANNYFAKVRQVFLQRSGVPLDRLSPLRGEPITRPVLFLEDTSRKALGPDWARAKLETAEVPVGALVPWENADVTPQATKTLRDTLKKSGVPAEYLRLSGGFSKHVPEARYQAFQAIDEFLNANLYEYAADASSLRVIEDHPAK